jgi:hypothetical protein
MCSHRAGERVPDGAERLARFLQEELGDDLRSVIWYADGESEVVHAREDVRARYRAEDVDDVVRDLALESLHKPTKEGLYTHGELRCVVECYDDGVEMHFVHDDGEGIAVGVEPAAFVSQRTFVGKCLERAGLDGY